MAEVKFEKVRKRFGSVQVIRELDLTINDGEFFTFVGPSGCGKSTLLNLISGLEETDEGSISFDGETVDHFSPQDRDAAMVFQSYALYPHMKISENIAFPLKMRKMEKEEIAGEVQRVAALLGIDPLLERKPKELSGGERQRVALARAIIRRPRVFLMDEPLSNLDAKLRVEMRAELKRLHQALQITTIYVTHDQDEAMSMSERIAVFHEGVVQQCGTPEEIYDRPANLFVAGFIGSPPMNFLEAQVFRDDSLEIDLMGSTIRPEVKSRPSGNRVILGIRPRDISVLLPGQGNEATVTVTEFAGHGSWVVMDWQGISLRGFAESQQEIREGMKVRFDLLSSPYHLFDRETGKRL